MIDKDAVKKTLEVLRAQNDAARWGWYFSRDEEIYQGPYETEQEAIDAGSNDDPDAVYYVAECHQSEFYAAIFKDLDERLADANEEFAAEDTYPTEQVTPQQWDDLEIGLNTVMIEWCARHNLVNWCFDQVRNKTKHEPTQEKA